MAIIGKIQKRSGLIFAIVLIALAAFVLGDFIKGNRGNGGRYLPIAKVDGEKISQRDFFAKVDKQLDLRKQQTGEENVSNAEVFQIKQQVYATMLRDILLGRQYEKLGLSVSDENGSLPSISRDELNDLVYGNNPHPFIVQNFRDPQTNEFNPALVKNFLNYMKQAKESGNAEQLEQVALQEKQWENLIEYIKNDRLNTKYNNLIKKAYYIPKALAKHNYELRNKVANFRFFGVRYNTLSDSAVTLTDADYLKYYDEHKNEYKRKQETRDIDYVYFEVVPSDADIKAIELRVSETLEAFKTVDIADVPAFVNRIPDNIYDSTFIKKGSMSIQADSIMFASELGYVYGPYLEENAYRMIKLIDRQSRPDSLRASHILISYQGAANAAETTTRSKVQAQKTADSLLADIKKNPQKFEDVAAVINDDPKAKEQKGDLDWFADGVMVSEFNEFCVKSKTGEMAVIETVFGYHIVKVTGKTEPNTKIRIANIHFNLEPSQDTYDEYWKKASKFVGEVRSIEDFDKAVTEQGLNKRSANLETMTIDIPGLENPRELVQWAFNEETEKGGVSKKVFEFGNKYVIAVVREVKVKGIPQLEEIKKDIEVLVRRDKKAEILIKQLSDAIAAKPDFNAIASKFNVNVDTLDFLRFDFSSVRGYGPEPYLIGKVYASTPKQMSKPVKGVQAVYLFIVDGFTEAPATEDYSMMIMQLKGSFEQRVDNQVYQSIEDRAKIEDNRILFY